MPNHYTEVTNISWGKRITDSFTAVIFGIIIFIGSFPLIWWNEGNSVERMKTLAEGRDAVVAVSSQTVDIKNNNALIHISGNAKNHDIISDEIFGIEENVLKLKRIVEMYQWQETKNIKTINNTGGGQTQKITYDYERVWSERNINSSNFKFKKGHLNPNSMPYESTVFTASKISIEAFELSKLHVLKMDNFRRYSLSQKNLDALKLSDKAAFKLENNTLHTGNYNEPVVGALRVSFKVIKPQDFSVIGKQNDSLVETYFTSNGEINLVENGRVSAELMFTMAEDQNLLFTWLIRLGGFVGMWMGLAMMLRPIKVLADVLPFVGSLAGGGILVFTGLAAIVLSFSTIALAWLFFRPIIGLSLFTIVGITIFVGLKLLSKKPSNIKERVNIVERPRP